jgi:hypothetical protein
MMRGARSKQPKSPWGPGHHFRAIARRQVRPAVTKEAIAYRFQIQPTHQQPSLSVLPAAHAALTHRDCTAGILTIQASKTLKHISVWQG